MKVERACLRPLYFLLFFSVLLAVLYRGSFSLDIVGSHRGGAPQDVVAGNMNQGWACVYARVPPSCEVTPTSLDFRAITIGDYLDKVFIITNTGGGRLAGNVREACDHYSIVSGGGHYALGTGEWVHVIVRFEPTEPGEHYCAVETGSHCANVYCSGVALPVSSLSQYVKTLGGVYSDDGGTIVQTSDGGFVVGGRTQSFGEGNWDNLLTKFNSFGDHLWTRVLDYGDNEGGISVKETSDGGFVTFGWSESFWADREHLIAKFDGSGNLLWNRTIRGGDPWYAYGGPAIEASDGGLVVFGCTNSFTDVFDLLLSKFDPAGAHLWTKILVGSSTERPGGLTETSDGGIVATGSTESFGAGDYDLLLAKFGSTGVLLWTRTLGGGGVDWGESVTEASDDGLVVTGYTESFGAGGRDLLLAKFDSSGNLLWSRTLGGSADDTGRFVIQAYDGGFAVTGLTESFGAGGRDLLLAKFDSSGNLLWSRTLGGSADDAGRSLVEAYNKGLVLVGSTASFGAGNQDLLLASFDSAGNTCLGQFVFPEIHTIAPDITQPNPTVLSRSPTITVPDPSVASPVPDTTVVCESPEAAVEENLTEPTAAILLYQNHPNPFNLTTRIFFALPEDGHVVLEVFDVSGRRVRTLADGRVSAGRYSEFWDAEDSAGNQVAPGIYLYRLSVEGKTFTRKCTLLR